MNLETIIISILGSGGFAALITGWMNHKNQIKAIKESGIYTKRIEVFDELMKRMEYLDKEMNRIHFSLLENSHRDLTTSKKVSDAFDSFYEYFIEHRHYLSKSLSSKINLLCREYQKIQVNFEWDKNIKKTSLTIDELESKINQIIIILVDRKEDITNEFRKIIGV